MKKKTVVTIVTVVGLYVVIRLLLKPKNYSIDTNTKAVFPSGPATMSPGGSVASPVNMVNVAVTNKPSVPLRNNPAMRNFWLWTDNVDQTVDTQGTNLGPVTGIFPDEMGDKSNQWYQLSKTSTRFLHNGDPLYVNANDVTLTQNPA